MKESDDLCECEANLFFKKYKDRIEKIFERKLEDEEESKQDITELLKKHKKFTPPASESKELYVRFEEKLTPSLIKIAEEEASEVSSEEKSEGIYKYKEVSIKERRLHEEEEVGLEEITSAQMTGFPFRLSLEFIQMYEALLDEKLRHTITLGEPEEEEFYSERGYYSFGKISVEEEEMEVVKPLFKFPSKIGEVEIEHIPSAEKEEPPCIHGEAQCRAERYLKKHKIYEFFHFLGSHLVASNSANPIEFLLILLENCLNYRNQLSEPPLLFTPKHVESLFNSMDPMKTGFITVDQYHTGMYTLGINDYKKYPVIENNMVTKATFIKEALRQLTLQLDDMIKIIYSPTNTALWPSVTSTTKTRTMMTDTSYGK